MNGKSKCKILKEIRKQIAAENDIAYVTSECKYKGDCSGTCPKCEAEVRYLEDQLCQRQQTGKTVAVAGIAAALLVTASGCDLTDILDPVTGGEPMATSYTEHVDGEVLPPASEETEATYPELMGVPVLPPEETEPTDSELMGDPVPQG